MGSTRPEVQVRWDRVGMAQGQDFLPQEPLRAFAPRACRSGPVPGKTQCLPRSCSQSALDSGQSGAGRCQSSLSGTPARFPISCEELGGPARFHFLCLQNEFLGRRQRAGAVRCLDFRSPDVAGRIWLSLGEGIIPPHPTLPLLTPRPPA